MNQGLIDAILRRDDQIMRMRPECPNPSCKETKQLQIIDKAIPAEWKCRTCKHTFLYEVVE